jgi:hypothetical protein
MIILPVAAPGYDPMVILAKSRLLHNTLMRKRHESTPTIAFPDFSNAVGTPGQNTGFIMTEERPLNTSLMRKCHNTMTVFTIP